MQIVQAFREGGMFMWVVLATALVAMVIALTALVLAMVSQARQPALALAGLALAFGVLVPVTGAIGYALAMRFVFGAVANVDPSARAAVLAQGISEAMNLIAFGLGCGTVPCVLALAAIVRAATRPKSVRAQP